MSLSDPIEPVHKHDRWTVADELFEAFVNRKVSSQRRLKLERELHRSPRRPADVAIARERTYDRETERLRGQLRSWGLPEGSEQRVAS